MQLPLLYRPHIIKTEHSMETRRSEPWVIQEEGFVCRGALRGSKVYSLAYWDNGELTPERGEAEELKGSILVCGVAM